MTKKLYLSSTDKKIAGVCGGIAEYMETDSTFVRLIFIIVTMVTAVAPMVIAYLIAWAIMPQHPAHKADYEHDSGDSHIA